MNNAELKEKLDDISLTVELLAKVVADQSLLILRMMAHQQAHIAAVRAKLKQDGESVEMLDQRMITAYQSQLEKYRHLLESYQQDGDVKKLLDLPTLPENLGEN